MKLKDWKTVVVFLLLFAVGVGLWISKADVKKANVKEPVFRDLYWGDPPEKLGEKRLERMRGAWEKAGPGLSSEYSVYMKIDDSLRLGSLRLESILYWFDDDRLCLIVIDVKDKDYELLATAAEEKYGDAWEKKKTADSVSYFGIGDTTTWCQIEKDYGKATMILYDIGMTRDELMKQSIREVLQKEQDVKDIADSW